MMNEFEQMISHGRTHSYKSEFKTIRKNFPKPRKNTPDSGKTNEKFKVKLTEPRLTQRYAFSVLELYFYLCTADPL